MCYSLYKGLKEDYIKLEKKKSEKQMDDYEGVVKEIVERRNKKES
jgi:choline/glycine/proline betaine transport protein